MIATEFSSLVEQLGRPPVVLQVLPALVTGGVERGTVDMAAALVAAGARALVASAGGPMVAELELAGARHVAMPLASKDPVTMLRNAGRLARLIQAARVDLVHARSRAPAWSAWWAARRTGIPFVTTFHSPYGSGPVWLRPLKERYNEVMAKGERVIAISGFVADEVVRRFGVDRARIRVIHRGVDLTRFDLDLVTAGRVDAVRAAWRVPAEVPVVLLPGRLSRWKGQEVLLEALARMRWSDAHAVLVGSARGGSDYPRELARLAAQLDLGARVHLAGEARDMPAAIAAAEVVVSASIEPEAFGRVMAEGLAMGRPVVASAHGAALEIVREGETGWLVPPGDPAALAAALDAALDLDPAARALLAARAAADVRARFTLERMAEATLAVYAEVLRVSC